MSTSIWEDFGVNTVITPDENAHSEHEQAMLALDVSARSGDDTFETQQQQQQDTDITDSQGLSESLSDQGTDPLGEQDEDSIRVNTDTGEVEGDETQEQDEEDANSGVDTDSYDIPSDDPELTGSVEALREHTEGFEAMVSKVINEGVVTEEQYEALVAEYEAGGLSDKSYAMLEAGGYSKQFINAFIQGQDALTQAYADKLINYVGGRERYEQTYNWLEQNNPAMLSMLDEATNNMEYANVKAIFDSVSSQRIARYGKAPQRSLTSRSSTNRPKAPEAASQGFASMSDMMKAMSDKRYANDAAYRAEVERRVAAM